MERARLIVDAMNVIGSRPDGWWRDRDGAVRRLVEQLKALAETEDVEITAVIDGRPIAGLPEAEHGGVRVLYALRGGPNAADDRIVSLVEADADPVSLEVVTSDRDLAARTHERGAVVHPAGALLGWLDSLEDRG